MKTQVAGKSNKGGERLLILKGNVWWFRRQVPKACRHATDGRVWLPVSLHTSDVVEAKRRRDDLEALTNVQFRQIAAGRRTSLELPGWLRAIASFIAANAEIGPRDFMEAPSLNGRGGIVAARKAFGEGLNEMLDDLQGALVA